MAAELVTIPGVEVLKLGTWHASTGQFDVTAALLEQIVEAHSAHVLRHPVLKLGHVDPRFDGQPAVGYVDGLRVEGDTLLGDFVGVPKAFADIAATAYPDRSVECFWSFEDQAGKTWPCVLTAVALLGAAAPAVSDLTSWQGIADLYTAAAADATGPRLVLLTSASAEQPTQREPNREQLVAAARLARTTRTQRAALAAITPKGTR
ncbi:hypothetical protein ACHIPZ_04960 [Antrihabitans sp. NCIMB 15449]|uniref:Uncharacterized protein n=1 Tax=Antrihabitans spumae TaxID=3373370 RepID=A0ABW7JHZ1_9NOCA